MMTMLITLVKGLYARALRNEHFWAIIKLLLVDLAEYTVRQRKNIEKARLESEFDTLGALTSISPNLLVMNGPFQGMKYPGAIAIGSSLSPKILGSYEKELQPLIEEICSQRYTQILNIGCAEGYYAVGLALRVTTAKIFAYDANTKALDLCRQMAALNAVTDRITLGHLCDADTLRSFQFEQRALILSDCEGYEKHLFTQEVVPLLVHHDLLIETHDFLDIEISHSLRRRFAATHRIKSIYSVDDIVKAHTYDYKELSGYGLAARRMLLAEGRPSIMEWLYLTPRTT